MNYLYGSNENRKSMPLLILALVLLSVSIVALILSLNGELPQEEPNHEILVPAYSDTDYIVDESWVFDEKASVYNAPYVLEPDYLSEYYIVLYAESQNVVVYRKDVTGGYTIPTICFYCSSGTVKDPTEAGLYAIHTQYRWKELMGGVYGQYASAISEDYLFHSVPYSTDDPSTLTMRDFERLGSRASHGCIRLCTRDVKWIYDNCTIGTQVRVVYEAMPDDITPVEIPTANSSSTYYGWDPTDLNANSPYVKYAENQSR